MISLEQEAGLAALWEHAKENWQQPSAHDAFVEACSEQKNLAFAARLYRLEIESGDDADKAVTARQLEKITALAFAQIESARTPVKDHKRVITIVAVVVSLSLIVGCAYLVNLYGQSSATLP